MFCSKCGNQIDENANFCSKCGSAVPVKLNANTPPAPVVSSSSLINPPTKAKVNPFAFISAGIMGFMLVLYFCPWFFRYGTMQDVFGYYIDRMPLVYPDDIAVILFLIFSFIGMAMSMAGIVAAIIRKRRVPLVFALVASISLQISLVFFCFTKEAWTIGVSAAPIILFLTTFINIPFAILAKRR